jgi:hypothetical protein
MRVKAYYGKGQKSGDREVLGVLGGLAAVVLPRGWR